MAEAPSSNKGLKLAGKVAIVTGGASGIGEATARVFVDQGARMVVIADIQDELGNKVAASIGTHRCTYIHCNVVDEDQVQNLVQSTVNAYGQVRAQTLPITHLLHMLNNFSIFKLYVCVYIYIYGKIFILM